MLVVSSVFVSCCASCSKDNKSDGGGEKDSVSVNLPKRNIERAMTMTDAALDNYFSESGMAMSRYYNPFTKTASSEIGSVWMYTSSIEAVTAIMKTLEIMKDQGDPSLYNEKFDGYSKILSDLYAGAQYYKGSFTLTSYTGTSSWSAYAVNRASSPGSADMSGVANVYDDQEWFIRELLNAYKVTSDSKYLSEAENLTAYVMDGWDCTLDALGNENGGITWGPGYVTKHSCSNGPIVSPLVWLYEIYKDSPDKVTYGIVNPDNTRGKKTLAKSEYYLQSAEKVYAYQKAHLLRADGVYDDMMGGYKTGGGQPEYETVDGMRYRKNTALYNREGPAITYNTGTMLSGAADLYRATGNAAYYEDMKSATEASFSIFATLGETKPGLYTYDITGFRNWFNDVLMRGYVAVYPYYNNAASPIDSFQNNLDFAWTNYLRDDMLPPSLLVGWSMEKSNNNVEAMFTFAFASEYATLAGYMLEND